MANLRKLILAVLVVVLGLPFWARAQESTSAEWAANPEDHRSINLPGALVNLKKKKDVVVAVIDTGIDPKHPYLSGNLWVPDGQMGPMNFGRDFSKARESLTAPYDRHGHGTHIAGIIKGVYKDVRILPLKYYNPAANGEENLASTIQALRYAVEVGVDIINYSGGGPEASRQELELLERARKKGILVVAASGNEEANIDLPHNAYYPASYGLPNIMTVTAHGADLKILSTSNVGKGHVDISAPGERIKSSLPFGRAGNLTGTSQATAFVTGVAALIKAQYPNLKAHELKTLIVSSAKRLQNMQNACASGGVLDATAAVKMAREGQSKIARRAVAQDSGPGKITYRRIKK